MIGLAIALFIVGLGLVLAEVMIPSFGLFTVMCCACFAGSAVIAFGQSQTAGAIFVIAAFLCVPITIRLLLGAPDTPEAVESIYAENTRLVGRQGKTVTPLRPAGTADFDGERIPVVTEGDHVTAGRTVEVVAVEGNRIVVRPVGPDPDDEE
jgi:membrane-bound serine protease (ClpP class)